MKAWALMVCGAALLAAARGGAGEPGPAAPVLEELLNCARLGAHTRTRDEARTCDIAPDAPVGQTFRTHPDTVRVFRIALWQAFWHESWQPDEALCLTLWDSPERRTAYGRCAIPCERRMWEGAVPLFTLEAAVPAAATLFLELTVETAPQRPAVVPTEWKLRKERPGFAGGDRRLAGIGTAADDYPDGQAFVGGVPQPFDLWFEVHETRRVPSEALYEEAFSRFDLGLPGLAGLRAAVEARDWQRAVDEMIRHFEGRADLFPEDAPPPAFRPDFDTREADLAAEHKVLAEEGCTIDLGPQWSHYTLWPERGGVGLTRSGLRKVLAAGYQNTANEKYARAFADMLYHVFREAPSPVRAGALPPEGTLPPTCPNGLGGGSLWNGLSLGARIGHGFHYYGVFRNSPAWTRDLRAAFIINLGEMLEVFERQKGGGNWDAQMSNGLMEAGLTYPEFRRAREWVRQGAEALAANARESVREDGVAREPTTGYHGMMMRRYAKFLRRSRELGLEVPRDVAALTLRMYEFIMHCTQPDGLLVPWGDSAPGMRPDDLAADADLFDRDDFRYVGSGGREGRTPAAVAAGFPQGGFYFARSDWTPAAHFLAVRCGPFGSHGHKDALSLVLAVHGKTRLIDPGICTYGTPEAAELTSSRAHSLITVDGRDAPSAEADAWAPANRSAYVAGHNHGYEGLPEVVQHRRIWFLQAGEGLPALWTVADDVTGPGEHELALRYRFADVALAADPPGDCLRTREPDANVALHVLDPPPGVERSLGKALAVLPGRAGLCETPVAEWRWRSALPVAVTTVLVPGAGADVPAYSACAIRGQTAGVRAVWLTAGEAGCLFVFGPCPDAADGTAPAAEVECPGLGRVSLAGQAAALRCRRGPDGWRPVSLHGVGVRSLALAGRVLHQSEMPAPQLETALPGP